MNHTEPTIKDLSTDFALRIIKLYQYLTEGAEKKEFVMSKQILRSGTSIGANVREASCAQTKADFASKMNIALKEAAETEYWIELLTKSGYIGAEASESIMGDCTSINRILTSIVKTTYESLGKKSR